MYSAYLLLFLSAFFVTRNWIIGLSGTAVILFLMTVRLRLEEALVIGRFGQEYLRYRALTPMFMPRLRGPALQYDNRSDKNLKEAP